MKEKKQQPEQYGNQNNDSLDFVETELVSQKINSAPINHTKGFTAKILSIIGAIVGLIVIISLIIGGALLASQKWNPTWNPFRPKTDKKSPAVYKNFKEVIPALKKIIK